mgnify:CR=1 FL=1
MKTRLSPSKSRKIQTHSPSPAKNSSLISNKYRQKSPPSPSRRRRRTHEQQEFIRSSSCGDLPSKNSLQKKTNKNSSRRIRLSFDENSNDFKTNSK